MINIEFKRMEVPQGVTEVKFIPEEGSPLIIYMTNEQMDEVSRAFSAQILFSMLADEAQGESENE